MYATPQPGTSKFGLFPYEVTGKENRKRKTRAIWTPTDGRASVGLSLKMTGQESYLLTCSYFHYDMNKNQASYMLEL